MLAAYGAEATMGIDFQEEKGRREGGEGLVRAGNCRGKP
jgi:hypothetical protein